MFKGSMVALVTPMQMDGRIDCSSLYQLIDWHIASHTAGLVIAGTTGEGATLTADELQFLLSESVKHVAGRVPVIAGTGSYSTQHTLELTELAKEAGVDAALIVTPYYNRPTQQGLYAHYQFVAEKAQLPIILYNIPSRTACDLLPDTIERLAKIPNIIGIKEGTGKLARAREILERCPGFAVFSGDDATACDLLLHGAHGIISVTANVVPALLHAFCEAALVAKDASLTEQLNTELMPLHRALFLETNPIPVKWALQLMGRIPPGIRLPLTPLDKKFHLELRTVLSNLEIVELLT